MRLGSMSLTESSRHLISQEVHQEQAVLFPRPSGICWAACLHPAVSPWASRVSTPGLLFLIANLGAGSEHPLHSAIPGSQVFGFQWG